MLNIVSILIGGLALLAAIPAFLPLLGWLNWGVLPIAFVGAAVGMLSSKTAGRNFNLAIIVVSLLRLWLGGGLL